MIRDTYKCRLCDSPNIKNIWDFGYSPLANDFKSDRNTTNDLFPLIYFKCNECHSVQLRYELRSDLLFNNYLYESPPNLIPHFKEFVTTTSKFLELKPDDLIMDIGSNNGLLLKEFQNLNYKEVLGIEPAEHIAKKARLNGIPTLNNFFNKGLGEYLNAELYFPKLITCTNCFAHVSNLNDFIEGLVTVMGVNSYFVFENAYLLNTIKNLDFGQAYFEHFYMHSIHPLESLFNKHGLELFHVEYNNVQMGSIRGYVRKKGNKKIDTNKSVEFGKLNEVANGLLNLETYERFIAEIRLASKRLKTILELRKKQGESISIYGWPAKMTLLNKYFDIEQYIDYVIEESPVKIGKYCPGTNLEVKSLDFFKENPTNNCIIGAYNFENDIKVKNQWYQGEWINPLNV